MGVEEIRTDEGAKNRILYKNDMPITFDISMVQKFLETECKSYTAEEHRRIRECIGFLVDELDITGISMEVSPERYYFETVMAYLADGHTVRDLEFIEDDSEIFDYCGEN